VYAAERNVPQAEELLRRAIVIDPLNTENFSLLGRLLVEQKKLDAAKAEFGALARREPKNIAAQMMVAMIAHVQGDVAGAKNAYAQVLKVEPRAALAANNLASIYADEGVNLPQAQQLAEMAVEQMPGHAEIQHTLGWVLYRQQLHGQAVRRFQQCVAVEPENPRYLYHLGLAYEKSGEPTRAREAFEKAVRINPKFLEARQALTALGG
jgi:Flp pilus assembly protein TadD